MAHNVIMPKTGMAMEEGTVVKWLKKPGDAVARGDVIAVIETDKVTMDLESEYEGTLLAVVRGDGEVVPATHTIAWIGAIGETIEAAAGPAGAAAPSAPAAAAAPGTPAPLMAGGRVPATPAARNLARDSGIPLSALAGSGPGGAVRLRDVQKSLGVKATPLARRVAEIRGLSLAGISGTGTGGRVRMADVEAQAGVPAAPPGGTGRPLSGMRRAIAEKMLRSHQQIPAVTLVARADVTELAALRARINAVGARKISFTDFIVKAAATALGEHPLINSVVEADRIVERSEINIGIAVALEGGLIVPVVRGADALGVRQISDRVRQLAEKARAGTLAVEECSGGTFTITNLGMYGIHEFTPLINVPESAILGVGAIEEALRTGPDGTIQSRRLMSLCLTHDHRHIDGAPAAAFLGRIRALLEDCCALLC